MGFWDNDEDRRRIKKLEQEFAELKDELRIERQNNRTIFRLLLFIVGPATQLKITWGPTPHKEQDMPATLNPGQSVSFTVSPLNAGGQPSPALLSSLQLSVSDPTVISVTADPSNPLGGIVTALSPVTLPNSALVQATATATEPDGVTTESISGSDTVTVTAGTPPPPPPPPVAASLGFTFGTPTGPAGTSAKSGPIPAARR